MDHSVSFCGIVSCVHTIYAKTEMAVVFSVHLKVNCDHRTELTVSGL